jgi:translation initiation factor 1
VRDDDRTLVYSTDGSFPLPKPERTTAPRARGGSKRPPDDGTVRVGCERRRGGSVTLIYGLTAEESAQMGKTLRRHCGTGGTTKDGIVELQGDHRDAVIAYLGKHDRRAKRMGG